MLAPDDVNESLGRRWGLANPASSLAAAGYAFMLLAALLFLALHGGDVRGSLLPPLAPVPLADLAATGTVDQLELRIAAGEAVDERNEAGYTALMWAAETGDTVLVRRLLALGADPAAATAGGWTPLALAAVAGRAGIIFVLLDAGASINDVDSRGRTALHWAAAQGHREVAMVLLARGADVNARDSEGYTPLDVSSYAAQEQALATAEVLIAAGGDVDAANTWSENAAAAAAHRR